MALIKLYESASAVSIPFPTTGEDFGILSMGWYMRRYDCVVIYHTTFGGCFKLFRSGHCVRMSRGGLGTTLLCGYDSNVDKIVTAATVWTGGLTAPVYNDPISMLYNPQDPASLTNTGVLLPDAHQNFVVHGNRYYPSPVGGSSFIAANLANGDTLETITMTGSLTFGANRVDVTDDGWYVLMDFDNGTAGVLRFKHSVTGEQYETTTDRAKFMWLDRVNNNIWVYRLSDSKLVVYSTQVAPATISAVTMGANRCRYREDNLSVTVTGSNGEVVKNWPVEWLMSTSEGHLEFDVTLTDSLGVARNRYCGPGADDYVGASLTITARTAY